jgi:hypothetical protein
VFHLLGAKSVIATDIAREAQPSAARTAVQCAVPSIVRDILSPFADHELLRERFDRLRSWPDFSFGGLEKLGVYYEAPLDLAHQPLRTLVDFVYSNSVLEHVPRAQVAGVLDNLRASLSPRGSMVHAIHLEDHKNVSQRPFDFLSIAGGRYSAEAESARGNRIRASEWKNAFGRLSNARTEILYEWHRSASLLPPRIAPEITATGPDDLSVSHLAFRTTCLSSRMEGAGLAIFDREGHVVKMENDVIWNGRKQNGSRFVAGVYVVQVEGGKSRWGEGGCRQMNVDAHKDRRGHSWFHRWEKTPPLPEPSARGSSSVAS